jgi:hypothetical protein
MRNKKGKSCFMRGDNILWHVRWYTTLIRRVLVQMIGFISSWPEFKNSVRTDFSLSYKPWIWHMEKQSILYCCMLLRRCCDVFIAALHSNKGGETRQGEVMQGGARRGTVQHREDTAFHCCVIAMFIKVLPMNSLSKSVMILILWCVRH